MTPFDFILSIKIFSTVSLPSPLMVEQSFIQLFENFTFISAIRMTFYRLVIGFSISIIIGLATGPVMAKVLTFGKTMSSFAGGL
jgi:NitT/TauT family transport system permease protein